jgi:hypothetical protein
MRLFCDPLCILMQVRPAAGNGDPPGRQIVAQSFSLAGL